MRISNDHFEKKMFYEINRSIELTGIVMITLSETHYVYI